MTITELKTAEKFVQTILKECPKTRSNDRLLMIEVWERQGLHFTPEQKQMFLKVMNPETIRRSRQLIQERGLYRASMAVQQERMYLGELIQKEL